LVSFNLKRLFEIFLGVLFQLETLDLYCTRLFLGYSYQLVTYLYCTRLFLGYPYQLVTWIYIVRDYFWEILINWNFGFILCEIISRTKKGMAISFSTIISRRLTIYNEPYSKLEFGFFYMSKSGVLL